METDEEFVTLRECGRKHGIDDPLRTLFMNEDPGDIPLELAKQYVRFAAVRTP